MQRRPSKFLRRRKSKFIKTIYDDSSSEEDEDKQIFNITIKSTQFYDQEYFEENPGEFVGDNPPAFLACKTKAVRNKVERHRKRPETELTTETMVEISPSPVFSLRSGDTPNCNLMDLDCDFFDPDFDFDGEEVKTPDVTEEHYDDNQRTYLLACKRLGILPSRNFINALHGKKLSLASQEMGPRAIKPCIIALVRNNKVHEVDISGNRIGTQGAKQIAALLTENMFIDTLNLSNNELYSEGTKIITEVLKTNRLITSLDMSGNGLVDSDAEFFSDMLQENTYITELNLSHNSFREDGGIMLSEALTYNINLEKLDLSWNHLRRKGAIAIAKALSVNNALTHLNVAWNGFANEGCMWLADSLPKNTTLEELDLTCNRIDRACLTELLRGLGRNTTLESLKLSLNPMTAEGALAVLTKIEESPSMGLEHLDISGQCVSVPFVKKLEEMRKDGREIKVDHGVVLTDKDARKDTDDFYNEDPMMVLMEFMRLRNLRLMDLFKTLDRDSSNSLTKDEFREGLLDIHIPMTSGALDRLINKLDADGDGEVDFAELLAGQKDHKKRIARMKHDAKERNIPYEETDMGRLTKKLKIILAFKSTVNTVKAANKAISMMKEMKNNEVGGKTAESTSLNNAKTDDEVINKMEGTKQREDGRKTAKSTTKAT